MTKIVVAGGSGFIGEPLVERLLARGDVAVLSRNPSKVKKGRGVLWNPTEAGAWRDEVAEADVVINLAGAGVAEKRWSAERKRLLISSRLDSTRGLVDAMRSSNSRPLFISTSAIGYYGSRGEELLTEQSGAGDDFLSNLAVEWEHAAAAAREFARVVVLRFGVVLAADGGALAKMLPPFRLGLGGAVGDGRQWMSWIDRRDVLAIFDWLIERKTIEGTFNVVAPAAVTNRDFTRSLGEALGRPTLGWVPAAAIRLALGEMGESVLLASQRVEPAGLSRDGFKFEYGSLEDALASML